MHNLALAEDVVQDALCRALEVWKVRGIPENPAAWLMKTAKNCALDVLRRERTARIFASEIAQALEEQQDPGPTLDHLLNGAHFADDQLRLMFSCCHPKLPEEVQVSLILHILCGFSIGEVSAAFLSNAEAIKKRISRGKAVLAKSGHLFELKSSDFKNRLASVHRALYLLFNEGYHGASPESAVRVELCAEAVRLSQLLCENKLTTTPATHALLALLCFHAARLPARIDASGDFTLLLSQDRSQWDQGLIRRGQNLMERSAVGDELTAYHVEAAIAAVHASASNGADTNWDTIVSFYDTLMLIRSSPVVALNRALAISQRDGANRGLEEVRLIADQDRLKNYPFYWAALGELELSLGHRQAASQHFSQALGVARNPIERRLLEKRIQGCSAGARPN